MALKQSKTVTLNGFFLKYLCIFSLAVISLAVTVYFSFSLAIQSGVIWPANHTEQAIDRLSEAIAGPAPFDQRLLPHTAAYAHLARDGRILESNMSEKSIAYLKERLASGRELPKNNYRQIRRADGTEIIVQYDITAHFAHPAWHKRFPKPEMVLLPFFIGGTVLFALLVAYRFSKRLKREMLPLLDATAHIQRQALDFELQPGGIRELNDVLASLDRLKESLSVSLQEQWTLERNKRKQISAIAHDIKTPLTIIQGNCELMAETERSEADAEMLAYIGMSAKKIEAYVAILMATDRILDARQETEATFEMADFLAEMTWEAKGLCQRKGLRFNVAHGALPATFQGNKGLILRAVANVVGNAVDHSPEKGQINLQIEAPEGGPLRITIVDEGDGFSEEDLQYATTAFYTSQKERAGSHYGLGLFIAQQVAEQHGGKVVLQNRDKAKGAMVSLVLPQGAKVEAEKDAGAL